MERPFLLEDNSYDFNYQEIKVLPEEVTLQLGDSLQMICDYESKDLDNFTVVSIWLFSVTISEGIR